MFFFHSLWPTWIGQFTVRRVFAFHKFKHRIYFDCHRKNASRFFYLATKTTKIGAIFVQEIEHKSSETVLRWLKNSKCDTKWHICMQCMSFVKFSRQQIHTQLYILRRSVWLFQFCSAFATYVWVCARVGSPYLLCKNWIKCFFIPKCLTLRSITIKLAVVVIVIAIGAWRKEKERVRRYDRDMK